MNSWIKQYMVLGVALLATGIGPLASASKFSDSLSQDKKSAASVKSGKVSQAADTTAAFYAITHIKENRLKPGIYETEGYVTFIHQIKGCATPDSICPPGSDTSLILVSEQKNGPENTAIRIKITKDTQGLQKGGRYRFTFEAGEGTMSVQSKLQKLELIKFQAVQPKAG